MVVVVVAYEERVIVSENDSVVCASACKQAQHDVAVVWELALV